MLVLKNAVASQSLFSDTHINVTEVCFFRRIPQTAVAPYREM